MKKFALVALLALFACSTTPTDASAAFQVKIEARNASNVLVGSQTVADGGVGDTTGSNSANFLGQYQIGVNLSPGTFGGFGGTLTITSNRPGSPNVNIGAELSVLLSSFGSTTSAPLTITITATDFNFTNPGSTSANLLSDPSATFGTNTLPISNATFASYVGAANTSFDTTMASPPTSTIANTNPASTTAQVTVPASYSLTNVLKFTVGGNTSTTGSIGGTTSVTAVVPVPPAVALLATGALPLAGFFFLRRRKQA